MDTSTFWWELRSADDFLTIEVQYPNTNCKHGTQLDWVFSRLDSAQCFPDWTLHSILLLHNICLSPVRISLWAARRGLISCTPIGWVLTAVWPPTMAPTVVSAATRTLQWEWNTDRLQKLQHPSWKPEHQWNKHSWVPIPSGLMR